MTKQFIPSMPMFRRLFALAWPIIGLNVLSVLTLAVDTAMCGRLAHKKIALTALGFATQVIWLLMVAMIGLTVGTVALVARSYGARDSKRVNHILLQSTMMTVLLGVGVAIVGNLLARPLLVALGADAQAQEYALMYMRPLLTAAPFTYLVILFGAVFRGVGNTRTPFVIALVMNALNVFLNYGLILGNMGFPAWGLSGAAIGTAISQAVGVILLIIVIRRRIIPELYLPMRPQKIDRGLLRDLIRVGTPAALDMVVLNAAFLSIVGMLGRIDQVAVAAHGVGLRIQALAFVPGMSISQATGALVGQALGANKIEEARQVVRASVLLCFMIMSSLALAILIFAHPIVAIFDIPAGSPLAGYTVMWIRLLGYCMPLVGIYIAFVGMLNGAGATKTSLRINTFTTLAFQIPLSWLLGFPIAWAAFGVWVAFPLSFIVKSVFGVIVYRRGDWAKVGKSI